MIRFTTGNLLSAKADALVNTVNTVGVMGKGIALMFKEAFPDNFRAYEAACRDGRVVVGRMFVTERLIAPRWIINFPTKQHWRGKSRIEWIEEGLTDLRRTLLAYDIKSVALPPLGSGNGGLDWHQVRPQIQSALGSLDIEITVYEPTQTYQNVAKREGVQKLTPARALVAELVRRYDVLGLECTILEVQKLAYMLERSLARFDVDNPTDLGFSANRFGPFAPKLTHLLNSLDGSYLHCSKRLADAGPLDTIWFERSRKDTVSTYLRAECKKYLPALDYTSSVIDGFELPLGMELIATVEWLLSKEGCDPNVGAIRSGLANWTGGAEAGRRKLRLFDDRLIQLALDRLSPVV